jgi:tRNA G46 methylase TrmB
MKTDNLELIRFSKANFAQSGYVILEYSEDYSQLEFGDVPTEYELAFRAKGLPIYRLVVRKAI